MKLLGQKKRRLAWMAALLMTAILYAVVALKMDVRFNMNDDTFIMRALMGYKTGAPEGFLTLIHGFITWPVCLLQSIWPLVPWFSWVQFALLFLALAVISKSLMHSFLRWGKPLWAGALFAAMFQIAFGLEYAARPTFTCTAAMLGAAAAVQILSIDFEQATARQIFWSLLGAAVLAALSDAIRINSALPVLAYCGLAFGYVFWEHFGKKAKRSSHPMFLALIAAACVFLGMIGVRQLEVAWYCSPEFLKWDQERVELMDFHGFQNIPQQTLDEIGWDETTLQLAQNWFFLDGDISTEAFRTINEVMEDQDERTIQDRMQDVKRIIRGRVTKSAYAFKLMAVAAIAGFVAAVGALFMPGRRIRLLLTLGGVAVGFALMMIYLALQGRMPLRAVSVIAMPAVAMTLCLLPACLPDTRFSRICLYLVTGVMLVYTLVSVAPLYRLLQRYPWTQQPGKAYADLEAYAVQHQDCLFIADNDLAAEDLNPFPTYPDGLPMNISYWGGWDMRSPASEAQFERFGLDVWHFDPEAFLRQDVFFATGQIETPPELLLSWLNAETGRSIGWEVYDQQGEIYIIRFHEMEAAV